MIPPILLALLAAGAGYAVYEKAKKPAFQVNQTTTADGTPIKVIVPVPASVSKAQASKTSTTKAAGNAIVSATLPNQGLVFSPPKSIVADANGQAQPTAIISSPTGSSSVTIGSLKDVQRALNTLGITPLLKEDGVLGPASITNIKVFQGRAHLTVDGNAGPATKAALSSAVSGLASGGSVIAAHPVLQAVKVSYQTTNEGSRSPTPKELPPGAAVMSNVDIQKNLNILGAKPALAADGKLGPMSVSAIKAFQTMHGLAADGVAGPITKTAIYLAVHPT